MKIYSDFKNFKIKRPIVTIGTFDGVHLGHLQLINHLKDEALLQQGETCIFTFFPHPRLVLDPEIVLSLLNSNQEKIRLFEKAGVEHLVIFPFTLDFSKLSAKEFVTQILAKEMKIDTLVVGYDHHLGHDRLSDIAELQRYADPYNIKIKKFEAFSINKLNVSSTKIRHALEAGNIPLANKYLDYQYLLAGKVVEGNRIGRTIGFPTANIEIEKHKLVPGNGVYAVWVDVENQVFKGMLNIGFRPTIANQEKKRTIEVHILDFNQDIYDNEIEVRFVLKIRDEQQFSGVDTLKNQLYIDKLTVEKLLESSLNIDPYSDIF